MGPCCLGFGCCWVFATLGQSMGGILWLFDVCVSWVCWLLEEVLSFYRALSDCLCMANMTVIRGLTFPPTIFNIWMKGSYLFFFVFFPYSSIWESIMAVHDFYKLHGVWWVWEMDVWLSMKGPTIHNNWVLARPCMCIVLKKMGLWCLGMVVLVVDIY